MDEELDPSPIEELHDEILTDILCRLPCKSAFLCKCVSKRWRSLISEPDFAVQSLNTNHTRTRPEWTLLIETVDNNSLDFVPYNSCLVYVASTFKDLVLCCTFNCFLMRQEYHICNVLTKQWTSLPSSPLLPGLTEFCTATLVCEDCYDYDKDNDKVTCWRNSDYRYRVVVAVQLVGYDSYEYADISLVVYISETQEWRKISLVIPKSEPADTIDEYGSFQMVACNKILYIRHRLQFGSFDPFNVTPATSCCDTTTTTTSFVAKSLPLPGNNRPMVESEGRLYSVFVDMGTGLLIIKELELDADNNELPIRWTVKIRKPRSDYLMIPTWPDDQVIRVDPMNLDLIFFRPRSLSNNDQRSHLVSCRQQSRSKCELLMSLSIPGTFLSVYILQLQCWPTPVRQVLHRNL